MVHVASRHRNADVQRRACPWHAVSRGSNPQTSSIFTAQADENERGIKRTGLIYSPRRSWWLGIGLIVLSVCIFTITIVTAFYHP